MRGPILPAHCWCRLRVLSLCGQSPCMSAHPSWQAHQPLGASAAALALSSFKQAGSAWGGAPLGGRLAGVSPRAKAGAYDGGPPWEAAHPGGPGILDAGKDRKSNAEITPLEVGTSSKPIPSQLQYPLPVRLRTGHSMRQNEKDLLVYVSTLPDKRLPWADRVQGLL